MNPHALWALPLYFLAENTEGEKVTLAVMVTFCSSASVAR